MTCYFATAPNTPCLLGPCFARGSNRLACRGKRSDLCIGYVEDRPPQSFGLQENQTLVRECELLQQSDVAVGGHEATIGLFPGVLATLG